MIDPRSGCSRILAALQAAGRSGVTNVQMMRDLYILNATGRVSDLRKRGHDIRCERVGESGTFRYWLVGAAEVPTQAIRRPVQDQGELFRTDVTPYGIRFGGNQDQGERK